MKDVGRYAIRSVERAVAVMAVLAGSLRPLTLTEVAAAAELSVPTTFRLLRSLQAHDLAATDAEGHRYRLGFRVLEWGHALLRQIDVVAVARPALAVVRDQVDETTGLAIPAGDVWIRVARAEASRSVRRVMEIGERAPLHSGSTGLVFLAALPERDLAAYLAGVGTAAPEPAQLAAEVAHVRDKGYAERVAASADGDGSATVAVPIHDHDGRVVAALAVTGPQARADEPTRRAWLAAARRAAAEISAALGYRGAALIATGVIEGEPP